MDPDYGSVRHAPLKIRHTARCEISAEDTHHPPQGYRKRPEQYRVETASRTANHTDLNSPRKLTFRVPHTHRGSSEVLAHGVRESPPLSHLSDNHETEM